MEFRVHRPDVDLRMYFPRSQYDDLHTRCRGLLLAPAESAGTRLNLTMTEVLLLIEVVTLHKEYEKQRLGQTAKSKTEHKYSHIPQLYDLGTTLLKAASAPRPGCS